MPSVPVFAVPNDPYLTEELLQAFHVRGIPAHVVGQEVRGPSFTDFCEVLDALGFDNATPRKPVVVRRRR
jgi:hypothetical protein